MVGTYANGDQAPDVTEAYAPTTLVAPMVKVVLPSTYKGLKVRMPSDQVPLPDPLAKPVTERELRNCRVVRDCTDHSVCHGQLHALQLFLSVPG